MPNPNLPQYHHQPHYRPTLRKEAGFPGNKHQNKMNTAAVKKNSYIIAMRSLAQARMDGNKANEANALFIIRRLGYVQD